MSATKELTIDREWMSSSEQEPEASPLYWCKFADGHTQICSRVFTFGKPNWVHGRYLVHGVTHWRKLTNEEITTENADHQSSLQSA